MSVTEFLEARLAEDEVVAKAGGHLEWQGNGPYLGWTAGGIAAQFKFTEDARHAARHDPGRVLRQVTAIRAILAAYAEHADYDVADPEPEYASGHAVGLGVAVRHLAVIWSDSPDYQQEWKP